MTDRPIIFSAPMIRALLDGHKTMTRRLAWRPFWRQADKNELPERFTDARCDHFRTICSNGFESDLSIGAAFLHKPHYWPQCFPRGADGDACCTNTFVCRDPSPWQKVRPGDRLWVRESITRSGALVGYMAGGKTCNRQWPLGWDRDVRPSIHMPRWASRLTLTVTAAKIERLQAITEDEACAECVEYETADPGFWYVPGIYPHSITAVGIEEPGSVPHAVRSFAKLWNHIHGAGAWDANPEVMALSFTVEPRNIDAQQAA